MRRRVARRRLARSGLLWAGLALACGGPAPILECEARDGVTPLCGFQNPEDLAVAPGGAWLLVSQSPRGDARGNLLGFRPSDEARRDLWNGEAEPVLPSAAGCPGPPERDALVPHGIDVSADGRSLLLVNHGGREAVERFAIRSTADGPTLVWTDCVPMPEGALMNDVAALPDGSGFVVTEMTSTGLGMVSLLAGRISGRVWEWTEKGGLQAIPGSEGAGPNGIEVSSDGETLYFAEWVAGNLIQLSRDGSERAEMPLGFNPDNLTWSPAGRLLIGGQFSTPLQAVACFNVEQGSCGLASAAASFDPVSLALERIWTHDPAIVAGGISVALEHEGRIWLGTYGGDRLAWIPAP
jgi:hypothetical protein